MSQTNPVRVEFLSYANRPHSLFHYDTRHLYTRFTAVRIDRITAMSRGISGVKRSSLFIFSKRNDDAKCKVRVSLSFTSLLIAVRTSGCPTLTRTILKQLKEWHVIVSCDQLGETFRAAPTLLLLSCDHVFCTCHIYSRHCIQRSNNDHFHP